MEPILERIKRGEILVADGAMGSLLLAMAKDIIKRSCPEVVNLSHGEILEKIARLYFDAGAQVVQTNTFGGSPLKLSDYKLEEKTEQINRTAAQAVRKVVGNNAYVSASCGPSGKLLKPYGSIEKEEMYDNFHRQLQVLIDAGVDVLCIETMTDINEAVIAIQAARDISKTIPIMATMTFNFTPRGFHTVMGVTVEKAAKELAAAGADIIGSNCGNGIENMIDIAAQFKEHSDLPLLIQSNAGLPEMGDDGPVYPESPEFMAGKVEDLVDNGVCIVGGCCGTTPEHIRAMRRAVDSL